MSLLDTAGNDVHFGLSLRECNSVFEACDGQEPVILSSGVSGASGIYWLPKVEGRAVKIGEARRHDADDGAENSCGPDRESLAKNIWIGLEMGFPKRIAENDGLRELLHFVSSEYAAEDGLCPKEIKIGGRDVLNADSFRAVGVGESSRFDAAGESDVVEDVVLGFPIEEFGDGRRLKIFGLADRRLPDDDESIRVGERERAIKEGIHDAEDSAVSADAESEREDDDGDETGVFAEPAGGISNILKEGREPGERTHVRVTSIGLLRALLTLRLQCSDDT